MHDRRRYWSATGCVLTALGWGGLVAWYLVEDGSVPAWGYVVLGLVGAVGCYVTVAPVAFWWPWRRPERIGWYAERLQEEPVTAVELWPSARTPYIESARTRRSSGRERRELRERRRAAAVTRARRSDVKFTPEEPSSATPVTAPDHEPSATVDAEPEAVAELEAVAEPGAASPATVEAAPDAAPSATVAAVPDGASPAVADAGLDAAPSGAVVATPDAAPPDAHVDPVPDSAAVAASPISPATPVIEADAELPIADAAPAVKWTPPVVDTDLHSFTVGWWRPELVGDDVLRQGEVWFRSRTVLRVLVRNRSADASFSARVRLFPWQARRDFPLQELPPPTYQVVPWEETQSERITIAREITKKIDVAWSFAEPRCFWFRQPGDANGWILRPLSRSVRFELVVTNETTGEQVTKICRILFARDGRSVEDFDVDAALDDRPE